MSAPAIIVLDLRTQPPRVVATAAAKTDIPTLREIFAEKHYALYTEVEA